MLTATGIEDGLLFNTLCLHPLHLIEKLAEFCFVFFFEATLLVCLSGLGLYSNVRVRIEKSVMRAVNGLGVRREMYHGRSLDMNRNKKMKGYRRSVATGLNRCTRTLEASKQDRKGGISTDIIGHLLPHPRHLFSPSVSQVLNARSKTDLNLASGSEGVSGNSNEMKEWTVSDRWGGVFQVQPDVEVVFEYVPAAVTHGQPSCAFQFQNTKDRAVLEIQNLPLLHTSRGPLGFFRPPKIQLHSSSQNQVPASSDINTIREPCESCLAFPNHSMMSSSLSRY